MKPSRGILHTPRLSFSRVDANGNLGSLNTLCRPLKRRRSSRGEPCPRRGCCRRERGWSSWGCCRRGRKRSGPQPTWHKDGHICCASARINKTSFHIVSKSILMPERGCSKMTCRAERNVWVREHQILPSGKLLVDGVVAVGELGEVADVLEHDVSVMQQPTSVHELRGVWEGQDASGDEACAKAWAWKAWSSSGQWIMCTCKYLVHRVARTNTVLTRRAHQPPT